MEQKINQWKQRIDAVSHAFRAIGDNLDGRALNRRPSPDSWSVAQILEHLITINQSYFPLLDQIVLGEYRLPLHGRLPFLRRYFGRFVLKGVQPDRRRRMKTFPIWEPGQSDLPTDMTDRFLKHQAKLKSRIEDALPLLEQNVILNSPASRMIVYSLEDAFEIIVTHEERHLEQAREVLDRLSANHPPTGEHA